MKGTEEIGSFSFRYSNVFRQPFHVNIFCKESLDNVEYNKILLKESLKSIRLIDFDFVISPST